VFELSTYCFKTLREDGEFVLCRGRRDSDGASLLAVQPVSEHPSVASLEQLDHEYSLKEDLTHAGQRGRSRLNATMGE